MPESGANPKVQSYITTEELITDCTSTTTYNDTPGYEMSPSGSFVRSVLIPKTADSADVLEIYNNFDSSPATALNIMRNPEILAFLLAAALFVGLAAPFEIIRRNRARRLNRVLNSAPSLFKIGTDRFEV